jgi:hypothetical protein
LGGIVSCRYADAPLDEFLRRADTALYEARDAGRNTSVAWRPPIDRPGNEHIRRVLKAGQIVFNTAARLDVVRTAGIPETFKLAIAADHFSKACKVTAKQDRKIDVAFAQGSLGTPAAMAD